MKTQDLKLINEMLDVIHSKVNNLEIQKYIENHICQLLNGNSTINDITTGIEIYEETNDGKINNYFKLLFFPIKNDFNFKNFNKIETVYSCSNRKIEKKTIEFTGNLIQVSELENNYDFLNSKHNFISTQSIYKKQYLKNSLVYNYRLFSKLSSDFLIPSYNIEEETFINNKSSITKSVIIVPKHSNESLLINDIKQTNTILAKYIDTNDLKNITFINSEYLVGEKFDNRNNQEYFISNCITFNETTSDNYQKLKQKFSKIKI